MLNSAKVNAKILTIAVFIVSAFFTTSCSDGFGVGLGSSIDTLAPVASIQYPPEASIIKGSFVIAGECSDDKGIKEVSITISGQNHSKTYGPIAAALSQDKQSWSLTVNPTEIGFVDDTYTISLIAKDDAGHSFGPVSETVDIDNTAPVFVITNPGIVSNGLNQASYSEYGSAFSIEGTISESHKVYDMSVYIYDENGNQITPEPFVESNIDTSGNSKVTFARWRDSSSSTELNKRYETLYGSYSVKDGGTDTKHYTCSIVIRDNAKIYTDPSNKTGVVSGNSTSAFYLYDSVYSSLMSATTGAGLTVNDFRAVLNGTAKDFSQEWTVSKVKKYLDEAKTVSLLSDENGSTYKGNVLGFSLNPATNPTYSVSGFEVADLTDSACYESGSYKQSLNISLSAGLDGTLIDLSTVKIWLLENGTSSNENVENVISSFIDNDETLIASGWSYKEIPSGLTGSSVSSKNFQVKIPDGITNSTYYYIVVTGEDKDGYSFSQNAIYGFIGTSAGTAPTVSVVNPDSATYINAIKDIYVTGTAKVRDGTSTIKSVKAEVVVTNNRTGVNYVFDGSAQIAGDDWAIDCSELKNDSGKTPDAVIPAESATYTYNVKVTATSEVGVSTSVEKRAYIDTENPVITITNITGTVSGEDFYGENADEAKTYANGTISISAKVEDSNLQNVGWALFVDKEEVLTNENLGAVYTVSGVEIDTTKYVSSLTEQKPMEVRFTAVDEGGNSVTVSTGTLVICQETDVPQIGISDSSINTSLTDYNDINVNTNLFGLKDKIDIDLSDDDAIASVTVMFEPESEDLSSVSSTKKYNTTSTTYSCSVPQTAGVYKVTIKATDTKYSADNLTSFAQSCRTNTLGPFYIAVSEGAPEVTVTKPAAGNFYGKQVALEGSVESGAVKINAVLINKTDQSKIYNADIVLNSDDTWSGAADLSEAEDGTYFVVVSSVDKYGQTSSSGKITFIIDATNPVIEAPLFSISQVNTLSTRYPQLSARVTDNVSLSNVKYYISDSSDKPTGNEALEIWNELNQGSDNIWSSKIDYTSEIEETYYAWIKAKDSAGNSVISDSYAVIDVDTIAPLSDISISFSDINTKAYDGNFEKISNVEFGNKYYTDNGFILSGSVTESTNDYTVALFVNEREVSLVHNHENKTWQYMQENADGIYTYKLTVTDNAQNKFEKSISVSIDSSAPEIEITSPSAGESFEGSSYKLTIKGTLYDEVSGVKSVNYTIKKDDGILVDNASANVTSSGWTGSYTLDSNVGEGTFEVTAIATDNLGHASSVLSRTFYYDQSVPVLTENGIGTSRLTTNSAFKLSGTASDTNSLKSVSVKYDGSTEQIPVSVSDNGDWELGFNGKTENDISLSDGDWSFTVTATDVANKTTVLTRYVTIDTSLPLVDDVNLSSPSYVSDDKNWYNKDQLLVSVKGTDTGSGLSAIEYTTTYDAVSSSYGEWTALNKKENTGSDKSTYKYYWSGNAALDREGENTIYIRAVDVAGNYSAVKQRSVFVDTSVPVLGLIKDIDGVIDNLSDSYELLTNCKKDISVSFELLDSESGVASVVLKKIGSYSYTNSTAGISDDDNVWTLPLTASLLEKGSSGSVTVTATDNAGNSTDITLCQIQIDRTEPKINVGSISPIIEKKYLNGIVSVSGSVVETNLDYVVYDVYINSVKVGQSTVIDASDNTFSFELDTTQYTDNALLKISITAFDKAGNSSISETEYTLSQDTDRPALTITNATLGSSMSSTNYSFHTNQTLIGTISDDDGNVSSLLYSFDGMNYTDDGLTLSGSTFKLTFPFDNENSVTKDGNYIIYFRVTDAEGGVFTSGNSELIKDIYITSGTDTYGSTPQSSILYLTVDTISPEVDIKGISIDGGNTWSESVSSVTLGGNVKEFSVKVTAKDSSGIDSVTLRTAVGDNIYQKDIDAVHTVDRDSGEEYFIGTLSCASGTGSMTITAVAKDMATKTNNTSKTAAIDNTAPEISFYGPSSSTTSSGGVTVYGSVDSTSLMYYAVSTSGTITPDSGSIVNTWTDSTGITHSISDISSKIEYKVIKDASLAWYVYFDGDVDASQTETHSVTFNDYLVNFGITTAEALKREDNPFESIVNLYVWIKAVDAVGNEYQTCHLVKIDPQGDRPTAVISYPNEDGLTLGGTIKVYGTATDTIGKTTSTTGVRYVWLQIISTTHELTSYTGGTSFGTFVKNSNGIVSDFKLTVNDIDYLAASGYKIFNMRTYSPDSIPWAAGDTVANGYTVDDYGILTTLSGSSWSCNVNSKRELNPFSGTNEVALRIYAVDGDGKYSSPVDRVSKFDATNPVFGEKQALYLVQSPSISYGADITAGKEYVDDMFVKGDWYLIGSVTDDDKVNLVTIDSDTLVQNGVAQSGSKWSVLMDDGGKTVYFKYRLATGSGVGILNPVLYAEDAAESAPGKTSKELSINYDNIAPVLIGADNAKYEISPAVVQSDGFYTFGSQVTESTVGTVSQSGVDYVAFYFMRRNINNNSEKDSILNPLYVRDEVNNNLDIQTLTYDSGLYWQQNIVVRNEAALNVLSFATDGSIARKGGLVKIGGAIYTITDVTGNSVTINGNPIYTGETETAYIADAIVIDNTIQETGSASIDSVTGYPSSITNDDGDGVVEYLKKNSTTWTWSCDIVSKNLSDGPVELHYVVFDAAGNYSIGIMGNMSESDFRASSLFGSTSDREDYIALYKDTARSNNVLYVDSVNSVANGVVSNIYNSNYKKAAFIANNAPRIAGVTVGVDLNGNNRIDLDSELIKTYANKARDYESAYTSLVLSSNGKYDGKAFTTVKGYTQIIPEILGGNGNIYYTYNYGQASSGTVNYTGNEQVIKTELAYGSIQDSDTLALSDGMVLQTGDYLRLLGNPSVNYKLNTVSADNPEWFKFTIWDSTDATTVYSTSQYATVELALGISLSDDQSPVVTLSEPDAVNGLGHVEQSSSWINGIGYKNFRSNAAGYTGKQYDKDTKVSGVVSFAGTLSDNSVLNELQLRSNKTVGGVGTSWVTVAKFDTENSKWMITNPSGFTVTMGNDVFTTSGHTVDFTITIDTTAVSGAADSDVVIYAQGKDIGAQTLKSMPVSATGIYDYSSVMDISPNVSAENAPVINDSGLTTFEGSYRQMDIVPYITGIKRPSGNTTFRSRYGKNPVIKGEQLTVTGYNFASDISAVIGSQQDLKVNYAGSVSTLTVPAQSGYLSVIVNGISSLNNLNNDNTASNTETDDSYSVKIPDTRYLSVWDVNHQVSGSSSISLMPTFDYDNTGTIFASWTQTGKSSVELIRGIDNANSTVFVCYDQPRSYSAIGVDKNTGNMGITMFPDHVGAGGIFSDWAVANHNIVGGAGYIAVNKDSNISLSTEEKGRSPLISNNSAKVTVNTLNPNIGLDGNVDSPYYPIATHEFTRNPSSFSAPQSARYGDAGHSLFYDETTGALKYVYIPISTAGNSTESYNEGRMFDVVVIDGTDSAYDRQHATATAKTNANQYGFTVAADNKYPSAGTSGYYLYDRPNIASPVIDAANKTITLTFSSTNERNYWNSMFSSNGASIALMSSDKYDAFPYYTATACAPVPNTTSLKYTVSETPDTRFNAKATLWAGHKTTITGTAAATSAGEYSSIDVMPSTSSYAGCPVILYRAGTSIRCAYASSATPQYSDFRREETGLTGGQYVSMKLDATGTLHTVFKSGSALKYARVSPKTTNSFTGFDWANAVVETIDTTGSLSMSTLSLFGATPVVSYMNDEGEEDGIKYAKRIVDPADSSNMVWDYMVVPAVDGYYPSSSNYRVYVGANAGSWSSTQGGVSMSDCEAFVGFKTTRCDVVFLKSE